MWILCLTSPMLIYFFGLPRPPRHITYSLKYTYRGICVCFCDIEMNQKSMFCCLQLHKHKFVIAKLLSRFRCCGVQSENDVVIAVDSLFQFLSGPNFSQQQMIRTNSTNQIFRIHESKSISIYHLLALPKISSNNIHTQFAILLVSFYMWKYLASGEWMILNGNLISKHSGWEEE